MEQMELTGLSRPKGPEADLSWSEALPGMTPERIGSSTEKGLCIAKKRTELEEEDALRPTRDARTRSNPESKKWRGDGLEEQEFSIKEASFSEGSLKLKIQTTKRAKKPPKSLENYICPPEIRITNKQAGEQKMAKQCKSAAGEMEEEKTVSKKLVHKMLPVPSDAFDRRVDLAECSETKQTSSISPHQLDCTKPLAAGAASQGKMADSESRREPIGAKTSLPDLTNNLFRCQQEMVTSGPALGHCVSGVPSQITDSVLSSAAAAAAAAAASMPPRTWMDGTQTTLTALDKRTWIDGTQMTLTALNKSKRLHEVTEKVFGNVRRYGRKDSMRPSDPQREKAAKKDSGKISETEKDGDKDKRIDQAEGPELPSGKIENARKTGEQDSEILSTSVPLQTDGSKWHLGRKRQYPQSAKDQTPLEKLPEDILRLAKRRDKGFSEPKATDKIESWTTKVVHKSNTETETGRAVAMTTAETCRTRLRKNCMGKLSVGTTSNEQVDTKPHKTKAPERWSYLKLKNCSPRNNTDSSAPTFLEPPLVYPITPSSPLYTNTNGLTVIAPIKRRRGRPKKQPLLTVETIHEGTANRPVSPTTRKSPSTLKIGRKKHSFAKMVRMNGNASHSKKRPNVDPIGFLDKNAVNKTKTIKMEHILNEILSCSSKSNQMLKSMAPTSSAVSTVASTIEARLGKQINISKRGTIYIGKKRGRKPRAEMQAQKTNNMHPVCCQFENPLVPSQSTAGMKFPRTTQPHSAQAGGVGRKLFLVNSDTSLQAMPNFQFVSTLPVKAPKSLHSGTWKFSPPQLTTNSPSHLPEVASLKEVTLSPLSESHSEETIPSDSGIGTDNNSTSDKAEKGPASYRRYSFDFGTLESSEGATHEALNKKGSGHCQKHVSAVAMQPLLAHENLKKPKHRRKRKGLQSREDDLRFLAGLEDLIGKFQVFRISCRSYKFYQKNPYPSIFRVNFDHYYPMPYLPYDTLPHLCRSWEIKSKKRYGRPGRANEPMTKTPFIQGFGYPVPSGNFYAPYAMPYTSMPIATSVMNLGYYGQYPTPLYFSHTVGATTSPFLRPSVSTPPFHSGGHVKLNTAVKHKAKHGSHQSLFVIPKGGANNLSGVWLHKCKHKHKHKHSDNQLSGSQRKDLGGLFSGAKQPGYMSVLDGRLGMSDQEHTLPKQKDKLRNKESTDALLQRSRKVFEVDTLSTLSQCDSQQWKHPRGQEEPVRDLYTPSKFRHSESLKPRSALSSDLFEKLQPSWDSDSSLSNRRQNLVSFGEYREQNVVPFKSCRRQRIQQPLRLPSPLSKEHSPPLRRFEQKEMVEIQHDVRNVCTFTKILSTKKSLDHVNKILKAKRLQRQAKTGNNIVKKRRGRPRKQPWLLGEDESQMPVLEKCVDLPRRSSFQPGLQQPLELCRQDTVTDAIESVVHMARRQVELQASRHWKGTRNGEEVKWLRGPSSQGGSHAGLAIC